MEHVVPRATDIPLQQAAVKRVARPGLPGAFALWMAAAAAVAVGAGLVLGILAALETGYGLNRWTQAVQAHGRLQLWAFAGVFIITLSFEFLARMNGRPPFAPAVRLGIPAALGAGTLLHAAGQVWFEHLEFLGPAGGALMVAASAWFLFVVARVKPPHSLRLDPQPWFFRLGAAWLVVASALALFASFQWRAGTSLVVESHAVSEAFLRGFVLQVILAVAPRAMAGHMGLPHLDARRQLFLLAVVNISTIAWLFGQEVWVFPGTFLLVRLADISLAVGLLLLTHWLRIFANLPARYRGERYEWALPIAWFGVVVYAVTLLAVRLAPAGDDLSLYQEGAIRHIFLLGFMLPLMVAMAHIVLARFGTGAVPHPNALTAGFLLVVAAWPLRVLPALATDFPGDFAQGLMGAAGALTMAGLALVAFVSLRTAILTNRPRQQFFRAMAVER